MLPQLCEIQHDDRKDGAELDQDGKALPEFAFAEIEKSFRQQQMAGRGNRQELGDPLDDAENHRPHPSDIMISPVYVAIIA